MVRNKQQILLLCGISAIVVTSLYLLGPSDYHRRSFVVASRYVHQQAWLPLAKPTHIPCDANLQPGYPHPVDKHWVTANPDCPGEYFLFKETPRAELWDRFPEFRNKTLLIAGDSVGRHLAETICGGVYLGDGLVNEQPPDFPHHYGWSSSCGLAELGFNVHMIHIYGMANTSDPAVNEILDKTYSGKDWDLQSRVTRDFNTTLKGVVPDYVQLNSGAWEYRYWFVRDILDGKRHDDMPIEDRETNAAMAIRSMNYFVDLWPRAKVWYMHMSMMNEDDLVVKKAHGEPFLKDKTKADDANAYPPMYTWRRQSQYRATMRTRIAEAGFDSLDYAQIQQVMSRKEFSAENDVIHPQESAKRVMSSMILSKIKRHSLYGV